MAVTKVQLVSNIVGNVSGGASFTGIVTATGGFSGSITGTASTASFATTSFGLSGTPNITVGNIVGSAATFTNLTVNGTQTIINTNVLEVADVNIGIASTATKLTNAQLDGAGITIYGSQGDKTLTWSNANSRMAFSTDIFAPRYYGDGSNLTGVSAGIGTEALISSGIVTTLNLARQDHKVTASGITTIFVSGGVEGDSHTVRIVNSGIATVAFSTAFLWPSGSAPVLPTASGSISLISFTVHRVGTAGTQLLAGASLNFS